jgi:hypothetical protein
MSVLAETSNGTRRAALTLHALERSDRAWLLGQLSHGQRELLEPLLADLETLGIPRDRGLIQDAMTAEATFAVPAHMALDAKAWCLVLVREPEAVRALWLAAVQESERHDLLRHWPLPLEKPSAAIAAVHWPEALREAVKECWAELAREGRDA